MANVYIKTVNGGENTSPAATDAIELDDGSTSKWTLLSAVRTLFKTTYDTLYVALLGDQTVAGVKTFSSSPIVPTPTTDMQASTKKYVTDNAVFLTGDQSVAGVKTFASFPITPSSAPTTDYQVANKKYVLDNAAASAYPPNYRYGCALSNNSGDATNDIDIAIGNHRDSTNSVNMDGAAMTKRLDADWAAGTNQGMRYKGAAIANTTYHIYKVSKAAGADVDYYAHTSTTVATVITALQAETGGGDYLYARRIGSIIRAGAVILPFDQRDNEFSLRTPVVDINVSDCTTSSTTRTLASVPTGIIANASLTAFAYKASNYAAVYIRALTQADVAAAYNTTANVYDVSGGAGASNNLRAVTNTSAQIGDRSNVTGTSLIIITRGWMDINL